MSRRSRRELRAEKKHRQKVSKQLLDEYYSMSWFGQSATGMLYQMATQLSRPTNDQLWWAIVGLADHYVYEKIESEQYVEQVDNFRDIVAQCNSADPFDRSGVSEPSSSSADDFGILYKPREFRFMLFRHWSLYDSMFHSGYIASKLGLWRDHGRKKLQNLLAQMGFSLIQSNQPYYEMDFALRNDIYDKLEDKSVAYGLTDLSYPSFQRHYGFKCILSATDVVYTLTALLETSRDIATRLGVELEASGYSADERWIWKDDKNPFGGNSGFYLALDALSK